MVKNLKQLLQHFNDEQKCRDFMVQYRWNGSPECPYCGSNKFYVIENGKRFKCGNSECYKKYSVTVGTIFHASNIPLTTWFPAVYLITSHKKGISSIQLGKDLGVTQKTAWFMMHRVREAFKQDAPDMLKNVVEVDEVYIGGKVKNMSNKKRAAMRTENGGTENNKIMVMGMLERGGDLRFVVGGKADNSNANIQPIVKENIDKTAMLFTDSSSNYLGLDKEFAGHETVNHSTNEYVRNGFIHTNSVEGAFSLFKRSIVGIYHHISPKHLHRYCNETEYRYNTRKQKDGNRFEYTLERIEARLSYKELIKKTELSADLLINPKLPNLDLSSLIFEPRTKNGKAIYQIKDGIITAQYPSLLDAAKVTGIKWQNISRVLRGKRNSTGGYHWKYVI